MPIAHALRCAQGKRTIIAYLQLRTSFAATHRHADGDQPSVAVEIGSKATASRAARRDGGSDLPRFSARRRIPAQAVWLK